MIRATEMDVTFVGLQNAGKTSLVRVLAVSPDPCLVTLFFHNNLMFMTGRRVYNRVNAIYRFMQVPRLTMYSSLPTVGFNMKKVTKGHVTLKW